ncbi:hypothetical protein D3C78_1230760 [compost metagenome]
MASMIATIWLSFGWAWPSFCRRGIRCCSRAPRMRSQSSSSAARVAISMPPGSRAISCRVMSMDAVPPEQV